MITTKNKSYEEQVKLLAEHIEETEAIVVGAEQYIFTGRSVENCVSGI